jgi:RHS repeat-associated protein
MKALASRGAGTPRALGRIRHPRHRRRRRVRRHHPDRVVHRSANGAVSARMETATPFGRVDRIGSAVAMFVGFTSLFDDSSGLLLAKMRPFEPTLGTWLSEDPIGLAGGPNKYAYVWSNPVRLVDPEGTQAIIRRPDQQNGNIGNWCEPQDNICSQPMGVLGFNLVPCIKRCCQRHDDC